MAVLDKNGLEHLWGIIVDKLGDKADLATFNTLVNTVNNINSTVGGHTSSISSLGSRVTSCESAMQNSGSLVKSYSTKSYSTSTNGATVTISYMATYEIALVTLNRNTYPDDDEHVGLPSVYLKAPSGGKYLVIAGNSVSLVVGSGNVAYIAGKVSRELMPDSYDYIVWRIA